MTQKQLEALRLDSIVISGNGYKHKVIFVGKSSFMIECLDNPHHKGQQDHVTRLTMKNHYKKYEPTVTLTKIFHLPSGCHHIHETQWARPEHLHQFSHLKEVHRQTKVIKEWK